MPEADVPQVTVVIVNYNGAHLLRPCLSALEAQDLPRQQYEVWMVDNDSHDESVRLVEREFPRVRVVQSGRNAGFAGGNNVALRDVRTPLVALVNNDARPEPSWLRNLIAPLLRPGGERIGATTGKLVFDQRYVPLSFSTPAFLPGAVDGRDLGVKVFRVEVDGQDVTESVLWDHLASHSTSTATGY
jgi:cellulose synthase/poly-beta-1,6-N-acetylglucosamine synthase-like glycosyltransferase